MTRQDGESVVIIIPARYGSTRLPGKPLLDIAGKPMIQHVYERARSVRGVGAVVVATDDARIESAVLAFGGSCLMTAAGHQSGTDRLCEVMRMVHADLYINLQGDEPLVRPADIELLANLMLADPTSDVGTLCHEFSLEEARDENAVKVVMSNEGDALYFSRSLIPFPRDGASARYYKHSGVYAFRKMLLEVYGSMPQPMAEQAERLEQLRLLAAGFRIRMQVVPPTGTGVDTPACLERVRAILAPAV